MVIDHEIPTRSETSEGRNLLSIVLVNYRTPKLVIDCLRSLAAERNDLQFKAVVVDNASEDGSADDIMAAVVTEDWGDWVRVVRSGRNGGFSAGNNEGIRAEPSELYLLLNSDTVVRRGVLKELVRAGELHPEAGLIGPCLENPDGTAQRSCFRYPTFFSEIIRGASTGAVTRLLGRWSFPTQLSDTPVLVPWIGFAAVLVRHEVLLQTGLMDEGFFMYFEDVDYCRRVRRVGWKVLYWPSARIVHLHGQSSGLVDSANSRSRRPRYYYESRARYFCKWHGRFGWALANVGWHLGRLIGGCRDWFGRPSTSFRREWVDIWQGFLTTSPFTATDSADHSK